MEELYTITSRLLIAFAAGGIIGLERAYNGRPAGLRTHALVCVSSSLLMLLTVFQWDLLSTAPLDTVRVDPTRMAQGIMTGIGFLGAGVIMQGKLSVRGLTTAASVWMTAAIGIIMGMGFYDAGFLATGLTLLILSMFGWLEKRLPSRRYAKLTFHMNSPNVITESELTNLISNCNIRGWDPSYQLAGEQRLMEYQLTIYTNNSSNFQKLAEKLSSMERVDSYSIMPTGD